ncbi:primosomal protein N' [Streptomyces griseoloalbus]
MLGAGRHALLTADSGPEKRYRQWLAVRRGLVRAVVGTRAAMFAPVRDLGLVAVWDDGDSSHSDTNAPFPHVREVLELRAAQGRCAFLLGGTSCTVEAAQLVESGWALPLLADRERRAGRRAAGADRGRPGRSRGTRPPGPPACPRLAWQAVREGLRHGPVLVQVPRRGYVPRMACATLPRARAVPPLLRPSGGARLRRPALRVVRAAPRAAWHCPGVRRASGCGRRWWARAAPPRSWAARSPRSRCARRGASTCWTRCRRRPRWW